MTTHLATKNTCWSIHRWKRAIHRRTYNLTNINNLWPKSPRLSSICCVLATRRGCFLACGRAKMSDARQIATFGAAALVATALALAAAAPAWSQPPVEVIGKPSSQVRHVPYGDLSLATKDGQRILYRRVGYAVRDVCPITAEDGAWYDSEGCRKFAWRGARPQMKLAFDRAISGSSLAMTSSITISTAK